jgi:hypothetical protein
MIKFLLYLFLTFSFIYKSQALDLFGYQLYADVHQYINDGEFNYNKKKIDSIELSKDRVLIPNTNLTKYIIKSTIAGNIYEIHGANNQLNITPVECLSIQETFLKSFEEKNSNLFQIEKKRLPVSLKSKITWDIYLIDKIENNNFIFSVTCDYSFNNRRMDIILSDKEFMIRENKISNKLSENTEEKTKQLKIDTSGI